MQLNKNFSLILLLITFIQPLIGFADVEFKEPIHSGWHCQPSEIVHTTSPDSSAVSFILNGSMQLERLSTQHARVQKYCLIQIPFNGNPNTEAKDLIQDWRMFASLPQNSSLIFETQSWIWTYSKVQNYNRYPKTISYSTNTKQWQGPFNEDIFFQTKIGEPHPKKCGKRYFLTISVRFQLTNNSTTEAALADIDSLDLAQNLNPSITSQNCIP